MSDEAKDYASPHKRQKPESAQPNGRAGLSNHSEPLLPAPANPNWWSENSMIQPRPVASGEIFGQPFKKSDALSHQVTYDQEFPMLEGSPTKTGNFSPKKAASFKKPSPKKPSPTKLALLHHLNKTCKAEDAHVCPTSCKTLNCNVCHVEVLKVLSCGHQKWMQCYESTVDAFCGVKVDKRLPNCLHTASIHCSAKLNKYQCEETCLKLLCDDGHRCLKRCWMSCGPCDEKVARRLACGHNASVECYKKEREISCETIIDTALPKCGHRVRRKCGAQQNFVCLVDCNSRLNCGHKCTLRCHAISAPGTHSAKCWEPCNRLRTGCRGNHELKCPRMCNEPCLPCDVPDLRQLDCGHSKLTQCGVLNQDIKCMKIVEKHVPGCGHTIMIPCTSTPSPELCEQTCARPLTTCGHPCKKKCNEKCTPEHCQVPVLVRARGICEHEILKSCSTIKSGEPETEEDRINSLKQCPQPCLSELDCKHKCMGNCGSCFNGRLHRACGNICDRNLICGHICKINCGSSCPSCEERCEVRCEHTTCGKKCFEPCVNCIYECGAKCKHSQCKRKCWEFCVRIPCDEPCDKKLCCGHPCVGLCGESCPSICRVCRNENFLDVAEDLYNTFCFEDVPEARYVTLQDCGHSFEVDLLDRHMRCQSEENEVKMIRCPRCHSIIYRSHRYGNIIKKRLAEIGLLKEKHVNSSVMMDKFCKDGHSNLIKVSSLRQSFNFYVKRQGFYQLLNHHFEEMCKYLQSFFAKMFKANKHNRPEDRPVMSKHMQYLYEVKIELVEQLFLCIKNAYQCAPSTGSSSVVTMKSSLFEEIGGQVERIIESLFSRSRCTPSEYLAFFDEIERLNLIRVFYLLQSVRGYNAATAEAVDLKKLLLLSAGKLNVDKETVKKLLHNLAASLKTDMEIWDQERKEIVRTMGLEKGHWFKCPNGHFYVIDRCGGAMQLSNCPECKAPIGGTQHRIVDNNLLASEMDGADRSHFPSSNM